MSVGYEKPKFHVAMFPLFAYGHILPYLHLSNRLAEEGHRISFILPKSAVTRVEPQNSHPQLVSFIPVEVPHVEGLPQGAETTTDTPPHLYMLLLEAFHMTEPQVEAILTRLKPDFIFFDFSSWVTKHARRLNSVSVFFSIVSTTVLAHGADPLKKLSSGKTLEELVQQPFSGYPSSCVTYKMQDVISMTQPERDGLMAFSTCITSSMKDCDVMVSRNCRELEGKFCDYLSKQYQKRLLLTGSLIPKQVPQNPTPAEAKLITWLNRFESGSVVYCAFGSQIKLPIEQFQELLLGFELCGFPFLVALPPPFGCSTVEEAFPQGFKERVGGKGLVNGGWVPQTLILNHSSVGCFVTHCGLSSIWESLLFSDCQMVLIPYLFDQILTARLLVHEFKVAVEVEKSEHRWVSKESLVGAIKFLMDRDNPLAADLRNNHAELRKKLYDPKLQEDYFTSFVQNLEEFLASRKQLSI